MILQCVNVFSLKIPFLSSFKHAAAERAETHSIWVEASGQDGTLGFGEGCLRAYVSGETLSTARSFVTANMDDWLTTSWDVQALREWISRHESDIDANPAVWSAIELALLDVIGKQAKRPVESMLGQPALAGQFQYTAVLGDGPPRDFEAMLRRFLQAGFMDFKIKLSGDRVSDRAKAQALHSAGISPERVRADANNLWSEPDKAVEHIAALDFPFCALEEPVRPGDWSGMRDVGSALRSRIILDESLLRVSQLDELGDQPSPWILNLRISKMGGLLRSLSLAAAARQRGLSVIVGAHVGETSLLTRAGLSLSSSARDIVIAHEGAAGTYLLSNDVVARPIMFGYGGILDASSLSNRITAGFQMNIRRSLYERYTEPLSEECSRET